MNHLDLFSGIGGFALAASWVWPDHNPLLFCEIDSFCREVLRKHWSQTPIHNDIRTLDARPLLGSIDILTGGFPCQPYSLAGQRRGKKDHRALWAEMLRVVDECGPRWIVGENVPGIISMELDAVLSDLETHGYTAWPLVIPAVAVDAPHRRDRVWIVAHADSGRAYPEPEQARGFEGPLHPPGHGEIWDVADTYDDRESQSIRSFEEERQRTRNGCKVVADSEHHERSSAESNRRVEGSNRNEATERCEGAGATSGRRGLLADADRTRREVVQRSKENAERSGIGAVDGASRWNTEPDVGRVADGVPRRVDRLRSLGNAIVPQVAAEIFMMIKQIEEAA